MADQVQGARRMLNAGHAHLFDYVTDKTTRDAITARQFGVGGGDAGGFIRQAVSESAEGLIVSGAIAINSAVTLQNFSLVGEHYNVGAGFPVAQSGALVELRSRTAEPIKAGRNATIRGLSFLWPDQIDSNQEVIDTGAAIEFPALLTPIDDQTSVTGLHWTDCTVMNAYRIAVLGGNGAKNKSGGNRIAIRGFAFKEALRLNNMPEFLNLEGSDFCWAAYASEINHHYGTGNPGPHPLTLREYAKANAVGVLIWGDGTRSVDGIWAKGVPWLGMNTVVRVESGGTLTCSNFDGPHDYIQRFVHVEPGGALGSSHFRQRGAGFAYKYGEIHAVATPPLIEINEPRFCDASFDIEQGFGDGEVLVANGANITDLSAKIVSRSFAATGVAGEYTLAKVNAPNAQVEIEVRSRTGGANRHGVKIIAAQSSKTSVQLNGFCKPVEIAATTGAHSVHAVTTNTGGAKSLIMADPAVVSWSGKMDKGPQTEANAANASPVVLTGTPNASNVANTVLGPIALEKGKWLATVSCEISSQPSPATVPSLGYAMVSISSAAGALSSYPARIDKRAGFNSALLWADGLTLRAGPAPIALTADSEIYVVVQCGYSGADAPRAKASLYVERVKE